MDSITCTSCGYQNNSKSYFCEKCGSFLLASDFFVDGEFIEEELKLSRIVSNLKDNPHTEVLWNDAVDGYVRKIERIQSLLRIKDIGIESSELSQKINQFLNMCQNTDFEIAFVGAVKAGKSTLINALLGRNYASTDPNPETAVLTKFRSSEQDYIKVKFYSSKEWERLWKSVQSDAEKFLELYEELGAEKYKDEWVGHSDETIKLNNSEIEEELKKWSTSQSAVHFFVKEIEVGISSLPKSLPKQIVFVDTPGLFDPVAFRSNISIDYIHRANAVLVCIKSEDLHGEEIKTVESVMSFSGHKRNKVFLVATNWDRLNNVITDWHKRYNYMVNSFTGKAFFPTRTMAENNILYVDSYHYNLCRDYNMLKNSQKNEINILLYRIQTAIECCNEDTISVPENIQALAGVEMGLLSSNDLKKIMIATNIERLNQIISTELINQYSNILFNDIKTEYDDILHMAGRIAGDRKKTIDERITISDSDVKDIEKKIESAKENRDEIQKVQKQLTAALNSLNKNTQKRLETIISKLG